MSWEGKMSAKPDSLCVAAIGDLHVHQSSSESFQALFEKISQSADVLALCGDLTHLGLPQEADKLANDLRACRIPVVAVLGNHDYQSGHQEQVKKVWRAAKVRLPEKTETFQRKDFDFRVPKAFGAVFDNHMLTPFGKS